MFSCIIKIVVCIFTLAYLDLEVEMKITFKEINQKKKQHLFAFFFSFSVPHFLFILSPGQNARCST